MEQIPKNQITSAVKERTGLSPVTDPAASETRDAAEIIKQRIVPCLTIPVSDSFGLTF
jgi:hypothetical protein